MKKKITLLSLLITHHVLNGQPVPKSFDNYDIRNGLSNSFVKCIVQDNQGFMWFGTEYGLNRFDGYQFVQYFSNATDTTSLCNIEVLCCDSKGRIWIGTHYGLSVYFPGKDMFTSYYHNENNSSTLSNNIVTSFIEDTHHNIWIATTNGLNRYNESNNSFECFYYNPQNEKSLNDNFISKLYVDRQGRLWVGTWHSGLNVLQYNNGQTDIWRISHPLLSGKKISILQQHNDGHIYVGAYEFGLLIYDPETGDIKRIYTPQNSNLSDTKVKSIAIDSKNNLWVGVNNNHLNFKAPFADSFSHIVSNLTETQSFKDRFVYDIYRSAKGNIWFATRNFGVNKYTLVNNFFNHIQVLRIGMNCRIMMYAVLQSRPLKKTLSGLA